MHGWGRRLGSTALALATIALIGCGGQDEVEKATPRSTVGGDLAELSAALQPLREDFEAAYGNYRLVAVLSPSCSHCLEHAQNLVDGGLDSLVQDGVKVFFIWSMILPSDTAARARKANSEVFHPAVRSYYDGTGKVTRAFGRMLGMGTGVDAYDLFCLYDPDATWDPAGTMENEPPDFNVARELWAPQPAELMLGDPERLKIEIPTFWVKDLVAGYEKMKASKGR